MSHATDLGAIGAQWDQTDTALATAQADLTAAQEALLQAQEQGAQDGQTIAAMTATVTDLKATVATLTAELAALQPPPPPPPPPPVKKILWGIAYDPSQGSVASALAIRSDCIRTYNTGAVVGGRNGTAAAKNVPASVPLSDSQKSDLTLVSARDPKTIADFDAWLAGFPDIDDQEAIYQHEPTNPSKHISPAQFQAAQVVVAERVAAVNLKRAHALVDVSCNMAYLLDPNHPQGDPELWYAPEVGRLAFDAYSPRQIAEAAAYAKAKGKSWSLTEVGYAPAGSSAAVPGDDVLLAWAQAMVAQVKALDWQPDRVCWMNHLFQKIGGGSNPKTTDFYHRLAA